MGTQVKEFNGHKQDVVGCAFVGGGGGEGGGRCRLIATASKDSVVRLWDVESGACVAERIEDTSHSLARRLPVAVAAPTLIHTRCDWITRWCAVHICMLKHMPLGGINVRRCD